MADLPRMMADAAQQVTEVRADGSIVLLDEETVDRLTGQQVLDGMARFLAVFDLLEADEVNDAIALEDRLRRAA